MAMTTCTKEFYDKVTIGRMKIFAQRLSEKDLRAYAAVEAYKLGYGGVSFVSKLLGMTPETIKHGQRDLDFADQLPEENRQRRSGAGRKGVLKEQPGLEQAFDAIIEDRIAGDPMNADIKWTDFQPSQIAEKLSGQGFAISENTVRSLLKRKKFASARL